MDLTSQDECTFDLGSICLLARFRQPSTVCAGISFMVDINLSPLGTCWKQAEDSRIKRAERPE